jgi:hypothetical protein
MRKLTAVALVAGGVAAGAGAVLLWRKLPQVRLFIEDALTDSETPHDPHTLWRSPRLLDDGSS